MTSKRLWKKIEAKEYYILCKENSNEECICCNEYMKRYRITDNITECADCKQIYHVGCLKMEFDIDYAYDMPVSCPKCSHRWNFEVINNNDKTISNETVPTVIFDPSKFPGIFTTTIIGDIKITSGMPGIAYSN